jgi:hypothetical protein
MDEALLSDVKNKVAPDDEFQLDERLGTILRNEASRLPKRTDLSESEQRCPTTRAGVRWQLETLFARHVFQVQDSLLLPDIFSKLEDCCRRGSVRLADIGSGAGAASVAALDLIARIIGSSQRSVTRRPNVTVDIVLNDVSTEALATGVRLISAFAGQPGSRLRVGKAITVEAPFPKSVRQLRRLGGALGPYDFCFMSYALVPLKDDSPYDDIVAGLQDTMQWGDSTGTCGVILQDQFHESMIRRLAAKLGIPCNKVTIRQKVYDPSNSNEEQTYNFYRCIFNAEPVAVTAS